MSSSSINAVIPALQTLLQARAGLTGVSITEGPAEPALRDRKELIQILDATGDQTVHALNRVTQPRQEEYDLNVLISVVAATRSKQATIRARAFALLAEVEAQLRSDPSLGIAGQVYSSIVGHIAYTTRANDQDRESAIDFNVHVVARL